MIDTVIMGNQRLWMALTERDALYAKAEMSNEDGMRLGELEGIVGEEDGYSAESDAAVLLQGLDIADALHERTMAELQGGQKVRVLLAQALYGQPDALLLDEPTNHLDLDSIHWLQQFLSRYEGTLIVISHDRHFLNGICTHIADIDYETIITYTGGYDDMVVAKTQIRSTIEADNAQREKKIAQLNDFIARFGAGTRASQVTSRRKEVERLQTTELARSNIQRPYIRFATRRPSGKIVLECEGLAKAHGDTRVISRFGAIVNRGDRIVLVGRNGVGKTTLLKALLADAPGTPASPDDIDAGTVRWGHEVSIGYFPQDHAGEIEKGMTAVEWLHRFDPDAVAPGDPWPARPDAVQRRGRPQADRGALRRRDGAAALLPDHAAEAERARARRADQPPRSRVDQRAERGAAEVRGDGVPRHARPGSARGSGDARLAVRRGPGRRLQGHLRRARDVDRLTGGRCVKVPHAIVWQRRMTCESLGTMRVQAARV